MSAVDIGWLDGIAQAALVRAGDVTCRELVESAVSRAESVNPALNAIIHENYTAASETAVAGDHPSPLAGVPMVIKDFMCREAGRPFHEGSQFLKRIGHVSDHDQELAIRFRRAGLVSIGRTNTSEFGMRPLCEPLAYGPTNNPWNLTHPPGGSSGGSAAAVAAGIVPIGHGNDAGGSIRNPASMCGLVGLKPSRGRSCFAQISAMCSTVSSRSGSHEKRARSRRRVRCCRRSVPRGLDSSSARSEHGRRDRGIGGSDTNWSCQHRITPGVARSSSTRHAR